MSTTQRYAKAESAIWVGLWGNMLLALFKGVVGWLSGSKALLADAFRTAAEAAAGIAALSGLKAGYQRNKTKSITAADAESTRGRAARRIMLSVVLLIIGLEIGLSAIREITSGVLSAPHWSAAAVIALSLIVQQLFFPAKEQLFGLYCSIAALIGASGAIIGGMLSIPELYYFDPAAAMVIALIVVYQGYRMARVDNEKESKDNAAKENPDELMQLVQRVEGVITVQSLRTKEHGHYVLAEIVISVNPRISVLEGQEIAKRVKQLLLKRCIHVTDVSIFVEPYDPGYPYKSNHDPNQEQMPTLLQ
ncbi:cation diffusion facilitator family transporter [Paenibacillus sp. FSL H8-0548]|uniref:cation diffusion facilitator family transporter n=1 Tax=Paenibacillus sp. FSL H8-0548 TaxID=1920422 RepID=UPI00096E15E7|nr:cation diffusion facilitator family transporter [Paenibacillus sp. FSL H8-0548]OMF31698.1 cation diffusion facilitator family transporter [Paenibacillus sp. FSL H8-0548]